MGAVLTLSQARRIALAAQGLAKERPTGPVTTRAVGRTFDQLQLIQIDSVNVLARSHYLPFFSRLGNYDRTMLKRLAGTNPRRMVEYWAHEASFIRPVHFQDLRLWQSRTWVGAHVLAPELRSSLEERILAVLARGRPLTARQLTEIIDHREDKAVQGWGWNWNAAKRVLEDLFEQGTISVASRTEQFERRYAMTEKVMPSSAAPAAQTGPICMPHRGAGVPVDPGSAAAGSAAGEAMLRLIEAAARAHGIGTVRCFSDYFRLPAKPAALAVRTLEAQGVLERVSVPGWEAELYRHSEAVLPRRATGRALLSPFDSLVFERRRLERLFGFHYRIEIYTPASKRRFGYYVLPFLLGERLVARVDLKADRQRGQLLVRGSYPETDAPPHTVEELAAELILMAGWLGLQDVVVEPVGSLAAELQQALQSRQRNGSGVPYVSHVD
ncbi:YcaQ family DNA glycosylase [Paenarthrobacter sp. Z7-10]|uniref:winged helix-turn-helix domain-containing protein n=1 Tax=Paenarthrobacter sp. Z7-10 TaxID=2787635 RepID=UPI0022A9C8B2|nr:crosslink repair DNA glycosylase YcaQ family protein [Paenarthrobacter sp. Z7-10]MCZ2402780.1 YcaQ family DNA glycosylase [Paenarthrobacter sp. Z7-10]